MADACGTGAAAPKLPKPDMRNLVQNRMKKGLFAGIIGAGLSAWYWKVFHMDYRQRKTKEYFETYDPVKHYERMRDMGLYQWAKPKPGSKPIYDFWKMEREFD